MPNWEAHYHEPTDEERARAEEEWFIYETYWQQWKEHLEDIKRYPLFFWRETAR